MFMSIAIAVHVLAIIIWVGGMFFAHQVLRPAAAYSLDPPTRLRLWVANFKRFFPWVWLSIASVLASGFWMFFQFPTKPLYMHIMMGLGILMMLLFLHVYFAPYNRLKKQVKSESWEEAGKTLAQIRTLVGINLTLGLITTVIATAGKYFLI